MRILHVSDVYLPRLGGIEMQVHDLVVRQRAAGHDAAVVTPTRPDSEAGTTAADPPWVVRVEPGIAQPAIRPVAAGLTASDVLHADAYDVVHVHASLISPFAMLAARTAAAAGLPTLMTVHSLWSRTGPLPDLAWGLVGLRSWPVVWSAVSRTAAGPVAKTLGGAAVAVLPNGIEPDAWRTEPVPHPATTVRIASVMRLSRRKRPMPLLRMLRRLRDVVSPSIDLQAVIVGSGPLRERMSDYLQEHGMDWVALPGRLERSDIRDVFAASDLYVAPAELESFGIAALEARAAGLPVVASRHGGVGEFIADGSEGFLTGSDEETVHALAALAADAGTRRRIAAHNRAVAPSVSWPIVLQRAEVLYAAAQRRVMHERRNAQRRAGRREAAASRAAR